MMKNFGKYDYVIQKYLNPGESPVTASEKGRIAQILIRYNILSLCIQIGLLIVLTDCRTALLKFILVCGSLVCRKWNRSLKILSSFKPEPY